MKIIGIDPSYTRTAVAMLDGDEATWWTVGTTPKQPLPERLRTIAMEVSEIVADNAPDHVVIEEPGFIYVYRGTGTGRSVPSSRGCPTCRSPWWRWPRCASCWTSR